MKKWYIPTVNILSVQYTFNGKHCGNGEYSSIAPTYANANKAQKDGHTVSGNGNNITFVCGGYQEAS